MKMLQENLDYEINFSKHKAKGTILVKTIGCLYQLANIKTEFKEIGKERLHTDVYTGSLQYQSYIQSSQNPEEIH